MYGQDLQLSSPFTAESCPQLDKGATTTPCKGNWTHGGRPMDGPFQLRFMVSTALRYFPTRLCVVLDRQSRADSSTCTQHTMPCGACGRPVRTVYWAGLMKFGTSRTTGLAHQRPQGRDATDDGRAWAEGKRAVHTPGRQPNGHHD